MRRITLRVGALALAGLLGAACAGEPDRADLDAGEMAVETAPANAAPPGAAESGERSEGGEHGEAREGGERSEGGEHAEGREGGEHSEEGEHGAEGGHDEEGEESGEYVTAFEAWDRTRNGARLYLVFDPGYEVFMGQVTNTTAATLCDVRVEVHLEGGPELGPTDPSDLEPGANLAIELPSGGARFERFTAHPEMSPCGA